MRGERARRTNVARVHALVKKKIKTLPLTQYHHSSNARRYSLSVQTFSSESTLTAAVAVAVDVNTTTSTPHRGWRRLIKKKKLVLFFFSYNTSNLNLKMLIRVFFLKNT